MYVVGVGDWFGVCCCYGFVDLRDLVLFFGIVLGFDWYGVGGDGFCEEVEYFVLFFEGDVVFEVLECLLCVV